MRLSYWPDLMSWRLTRGKAPSGCDMVNNNGVRCEIGRFAIYCGSDLSCWVGCFAEDASWTVAVVCCCQKNDPAKKQQKASKLE